DHRDEEQGNAQHQEASRPVDPGRQGATGTDVRGHASTLGSHQPLTAQAHRLAYDSAAMSALHEPVLEWYCHHARGLPWRRPEASAWSVLVSEIMLQQTPVARVLPVHDAWLERWPAPADLAADPPGDAVRLWGRLGYP